MMFGGMLLGWLVPLILLVLAGRWLLGNRPAASTGSTDPSSRSLDKTPQDILRERYARGEITKDEYEEMRQALNR